MSGNFHRIIITGANRGIGKEFVRQYKDHADEIVACARRPTELEELDSFPGRAQIRKVELDVTSEGDVARLADTVRGKAVDLLINNAGVYGPRKQGQDGIDIDAWDEVLRVNAIAPLVVAHALLDSLARADRGIVANITSRMGSIGDNTSGRSTYYRSSKAALNAAMKSFSLDHAEQVPVVLLLHPGWVQTDMGGDNANIDTETSVSGMRKVIETANSGQSGSFVSWKGDSIEW